MALTAAELNAVYSVDEGPLDKSIAGIPGKLKAGMAALAGTGMLIGGAIGGGLMTGLDNEKVTDKLAAQIGGGSPLAESAGKIAGKLYGQAYGDSLSDAADAVRSVLSAGLLPEDATDQQIQDITANVMNLATTFDQDLGGTTNAVAQMLRTGLASNGQEALDMLTRGFQQGDDKAGDLLDTVNEYGTQFRKLGLDGTGAMGLISQAIKGGARDSDLAADALKEFSIRAVDGSKLTAQGFQMVGLNANDMAEAIAAGGPTATDALGQVLDGLRGIKDPALQAQAATALFGTQAEDLGQALYSMDTSTAVQSMGNVAGAAEKMGSTLNDNASTNIESFKRQAQMAFVDFLGGKALPFITSTAKSLSAEFGPAVSAVGGFLTGTLVPALQTAAQWISANQTPLLIVAGIITAIFLPGLIAMGVTALASATQTVIAWAMTQAGAIAAGVVHSAQVVAMVAGWVLMGAQSLIQGARMAAAWVIAMGPVGWVIAAVIGLVALIVANWDTVVSWTQTAWSAVTGAIGAAWEWIKGAASAALQFLVGLFLNFTGPGLIIKHWQSIVDFTRSAWSAVTGAVSGAWSAVTGAVSSGVSTAVSWVAGMPGRLMGALGNLGGLLVSAGADMMRGFLNGIKNMAGAVADAAKSVASGAVSGVKNFLGIHSPSVVFTGIGENVGKGFVNGIAGMRPAAAAEMQRLADYSSLQSLMPTGVDRVRLGDVSDQLWDKLLAAGWKGHAGDNMEALYRPADGAAGSSGGPLFTVGTINEMSGTTEDLARKLSVEARTAGAA